MPRCVVRVFRTKLLCRKCRLHEFMKMVCCYMAARPIGYGARPGLAHFQACPVQGPTVCTVDMYMCMLLTDSCARSNDWGIINTGSQSAAEVTTVRCSGRPSCSAGQSIQTHWWVSYQCAVSLYTIQHTQHWAVSVCTPYRTCFHVMSDRRATV